MTTIGVNAFYQCSALKSFSPYLSDALTSMSRGANFNKCTVLTGALRIASPSLTTIAYAAFANGPAKNFIGPVEIYSPIDTIGDLTFNPCKDSQVFNFYSSVVPTSIGGAAFRANKTRVIINIHSSEAVAGWRNLCAANDATFETMKGYEDYPGKKTIGVLLNGTQYHWVVNCSPSNSGTSIFIM